MAEKPKKDKKIEESSKQDTKEKQKKQEKTKEEQKKTEKKSEGKKETAEKNKKPEAKTGKKEETKTKDKQQKTEDTKKEPKEKKTKEKQTKPKAEPKKQKTEKKEEKDEDFKYIVRIANTDIDGEKSLIYGLTSIKGIGIRLANFIADEIDINRNLKVGTLSDEQAEKINAFLDKIAEKAPSWMLNHRKDYETGEDIHIIGPDIDMRLRDEINIMKKIRSYRGIRHERGLSVRGQRTRGNKRSGLSLGVSKKRIQSQK